MRVPSLGGKDPLEKEMATAVFFTWKFHGHRSLVGYSPWVCKSWKQLSDWAYGQENRVTDHIFPKKTFKEIYRWTRMNRMEKLFHFLQEEEECNIISESIEYHISISIACPSKCNCWHLKITPPPIYIHSLF